MSSIRVSPSGQELRYLSSDAGRVLTVQASGLVAPSAVPIPGVSLRATRQVDPAPVARVDINLNPVTVAIQTLLDAGTAKSTVTQAAPGNRADVVQVGDERFLALVRATPTFYGSAALAGKISGSVWSVVTRLKVNTVGNDQNVFGLTGAGTILAQHYVASTNHPSIWYRDAGGVVSAVDSTYTCIPGDDLTIAWVQNGPDSAVVVNGAATLGAITNTLPVVFTGATVGAASAAGANASDAQLRGVEVYKSALTTEQYFDAYQRLNAGRLPVRIICDGNSLTAGQGASGPAFTYPAQLATQLGAEQILTSNIGVGAAQTSARIANFAAQAYPLLQPWSRMIVVPWEFTNTIYFGADAATTIEQAKEWLSMYRALNAQVILPDIIARASFSPPQRIVADEVNTWFAENWRSVADGYYPASTVFTDTDGPLYDPDGIHLNDAGYGVFASAIAQLVRSLTALPYGFQVEVLP